MNKSDAEIMRITGDDSDPVNRSAHYNSGEIEVIDYIRDKLTTEEFVGYCSGNVLKYQSRWRLKGGIEDLRKASVYLDWQIEALIEIAEGAIK